MNRRRIVSTFIAAVVVALPAFGLTTTPASAETLIVPSHIAATGAGTVSFGPQLDTDNDNAQLGETIPSSLAHAWTSGPPACRYGGDIDVDSIAVSGTVTVALEGEYRCGFVSAYDTDSGTLLWRKEFDSLLGSATVSNGLAYVVDEHDAASSPSAIGGTYVDALDLRTGDVRWSSPFGPLKIDSVGSGIVVGEGVALDATTGAADSWLDAPAASGDSGETELVDGGVIYVNVWNEVHAYSIATGRQLWSYMKPGAVGEGTDLPAVHSGKVYIASAYGPTLVLDGASGQQVAELPTTDHPIAFDGEYGIFTAAPLNQPEVLSAVNLQTGATAWSYTLPVKAGVLGWGTTGAPVIENGLVWSLETPDSGTDARIVALDETTGEVAGSTTQSCVSGEGTAFTIAQHRVFATSNCGVDTYVAADGSTTPAAPTVDRLAGADRYASAVQIAKVSFPTTAPVVFVATGATFPDALAAAPAAAHEGGPLLLTDPESLPGSVSDEIRALQPSRVVVVGGTAAVSSTVEQQLRTVAPNATVSRIAGADRYDTARQIDARSFGTDVTHAWIATGRDFPDALSAAAAAGANGQPVVLVDGVSGTLDSDTNALLKRLGVRDVSIAGGVAAVSDGVQSALDTLLGSSGVSRVAGADRYSTSERIAASAFTAPVERTFVATGTNFPDALAGSAAAASLGDPLLTTPNACLGAAAAAGLSEVDTRAVTLLGGTAALTDDVATLDPCS